MEASRNPHTHWPALGTLLLRDGAVSESDLERALALQAPRPDRRLGEILVEEGLANPRAVARVLAEQHELEFVDFTPSTVDVGAALLLPAFLARRYRAIPIRTLEDGAVLVAVTDPTNVMFSDELRLAVGRPIRICVGAPDAIERAITVVIEGDEDPGESSAASPGERAAVLDLSADSPAVVFVNRAIAAALEHQASDIHFTPQPHALFVRIRVDGVMRELMSISRTHANAVVSRLKIMGELDIAERRVPQDGRMAVRSDDRPLDVRMATLPTAYGEKVTLRVLARGDAPGSLDDLGLSTENHAALSRAIAQPYGAVIVVGPTGSGKTTTLFTCLQLLNTRDRQITTIEDPVEYRLPGLDQIEVNPRAGLTFASGLRTILRSDPDILLVGEIRDEETAQIAFRASMTGHLILTTLHAQTAAASIQRLADMNIERSVLATSINCIVAQRLVRKVCPDCWAPIDPERVLRSLGLDEAPAGATFVSGAGCESCGGSGYQGRVPLFEVMTMTDEIASLIGAPSREIEAMAAAQGMQTLREDGIRLAAAGVTTLEEVRRVVGETLIDLVPMRVAATPD